MPSLIYLQPMRPYPTAEVHSIQVTRTVAELGKHTDILLVVDSLAAGPERLASTVREHYGVDLGPRVRVTTVPRRLLKARRFHRGLREIMRQAPEGAVFYTRAIGMARLLLRYRWMHGKRVFLESHKKAGYLNKEPLEGSGYADVRQRFSQKNDPVRVLRRIYRKADCVFFLHRHSLERARQDLTLRDSEHLWYGVRCDADAEATEGRGFVYVGSLSEDKLTNVLLDALDRVTTDVRVVLYGGDSRQIADLKQQAAGRPCAERLDFRGWRRPEDLRRELRDFRFGIAMQEGMKVVDYIESGLTPVVPRTQAYTEVFSERHVVFYRPDDPQSLAATLDDCDSRAPNPAALREFCSEHSIQVRAQKILERLVQEPSG